MRNTIIIMFCLSALKSTSALLMQTGSEDYINLKTQFLRHNKRELDISNQSRETIYENAFTDTPNIYKLNMSKNNLSVITTGTFNGLKNLTHLDMSNNRIAIIESTSFIGLNLIVLELQSNNVDNVSSIVESCENLQLLNMSWNALKAIDSFRSCTKLENLLLSDNDICVLPKGLFPRSLVHLDLAYNMFESIDVEAFEGLDNLKVLDLEYNGLFKLEGGTVPVGLFVPLRNLERLDLSHNDLSKFFIGTFTHLTSLSKLDLGYNNLTNLSPALLINLQLKTLCIEGNELTKLDTTFLRPIYNISIDMQDNPWNCDELSNTIHKIMAVNTNNIVLRGNYTNLPNIQGIKCDENVENVDTPKPNDYNRNLEDLIHLDEIQDVLHDVRQIKSILETTKSQHGFSDGVGLVLIVMLIIIILVTVFVAVYLFYRYRTRQPQSVIDDRLLDNF